MVVCVIVWMVIIDTAMSARMNKRYLMKEYSITFIRCYLFCPISLKISYHLLISINLSKSNKFKLSKRLKKHRIIWKIFFSKNIQLQ